MIGQQYSATRTAKVQVVSKIKFQNSQTYIPHYSGRSIPTNSGR